MKFLSLEFENFMSFRSRQHLSLENAGLVLIQGDNRLSTAADSNGAGKSAIIDAVSWVLFGQTLRGLKADEVACRFTRGPCVVALRMQTNGAEKVIVRSRRPADLRLSWIEGELSIAEKQAHIDQLLGFGYRTFANAVVFGQGALERFALASNEDQLRMIDEIQGLDLRQALLRAKQYRDEWAANQWKLDEGRGMLEQQERQVASQVVELEAARKEFEGNKKSRLVDLEKKRESIIEEKQRVSDHMKEMGTLEQWWKEAKGILTEIQQIEERADELKQQADVAEQEVRLAVDRLEEEEQEVRELTAQKKCPTCRQPVHVKLVRQSFDPGLEKMRVGISALRQAAKRAEEAWRNQERRLRDVRKKHPDVTPEAVIVAETKVSNKMVFVSQMTAAQDRLWAIEKELELERERQWEGDAPLRTAHTEARRIGEKLAANDRDRAKAANTLRVAEYWVEAFGDRGLRSLLFDSVAGFLNERLTEHLEVLTAGEAQVRVSALSETKSGKVKERVSVGASWEWGADTYIAGSAGQDRRVDIALYCALQDLAEQRSARRFPIKVFDEAIDSIDARGREMFAHWLHREAQKRGATLVITHSQEFGELLSPSQVWTVVMDREGSRVEIGK